MKTNWKSLASALLGGLMIVSSIGTAFAADVYQRSAKDPIIDRDEPESDSVRWSGPYGVIFLGYGQQNHAIGVDATFEGEEGPQTENLFSLDGLSSQGAVYGGELGYDLRLPGTDLVIGVLGGYEWSSIESTANLGDFDVSAERGEAWWVGGRAGLLLNRDKTVLGYVKGFYIENEPGDIKTSGGSVELDTRTGWGIGGGIEVAIRDVKGLFVRGEYVHIMFDEQTYNLGDDIDVNVETTEDIAKVGLVYKIN